MHFRRWDEVASVHNQCLDSHTGDLRGSIQTTRQGSNRSEKGVHGHGDDEQKQQADEELRGCSGKVRHKVYCNIKQEHLDEDKRNVDDRLGDGEGGWAVELETFVFEQNRPGFEGRLR